MKKLIVLVIGLLVYFPAQAQEVEVTIPDFPNCVEMTEDGDKAHYETGLHEIAGEGLFEGADDVYSLSDGNALQCFCPTDGKGIQTLWFKTNAKIDGWFPIENGVHWNLEDHAYLALNSEYDCKEEEVTPPPPPSGGSSKRTGSKVKPKPPVVVEETPPVVVVPETPKPQPEVQKPVGSDLPRTGIVGSVFKWLIIIFIVMFIIGFVFGRND